MSADRHPRCRPLLLQSWSQAQMHRVPRPCRKCPNPSRWGRKRYRDRRLRQTVHARKLQPPRRNHDEMTAHSRARSAAIRMAASFASSKSRPCSIRVAPKARIAAFFSTELPCGTTIVTEMPARAPVKASDWPWLPRVAVTIPRTCGRSLEAVKINDAAADLESADRSVVFMLDHDFHAGLRLEQRPGILRSRRNAGANQRNYALKLVECKHSYQL